MRCVICGGLASERDDLTAEGLRCATCTMRSEVETHERNIVERAEQRKQRNAYWRAIFAGWAQSGVMMVVAFFFCYAGDGAPRAGWMVPLLLVILGLRVALSFRLRWAFYLTMAFDVAVIAFFFGAALLGRGMDLTGAAVISFFPAIFGALLYSQRRWYMPEGKKLDLPAPTPPQRWNDPGQRP